jgi:hypothetical protein
MKSNIKTKIENGFDSKQMPIDESNIKENVYSNLESDGKVNQLIS